MHCSAVQCKVVQFTYLYLSAADAVVYYNSNVYTSSINGFVRTCFENFSFKLYCIIPKNLSYSQINSVVVNVLDSRHKGCQFTPTSSHPPVHAHLFTPTCSRPHVHAHLFTPTCSRPPVHAHMFTLPCSRPPVYVPMFTPTCLHPSC